MYAILHVRYIRNGYFIYPGGILYVCFVSSLFLCVFFFAFSLLIFGWSFSSFIKELRHPTSATLTFIYKFFIFFSLPYAVFILSLSPALSLLFVAALNVSFLSFSLSNINAQWKRRTKSISLKKKERHKRYKSVCVLYFV